MSFTPITPYDGLLPRTEDPVSFDARAEALMSWLVANFAPEMQVLANDISAALNGEADTLAALQALTDRLAGAQVRDNPDLSQAPGDIPTRGNVATAIDSKSMGVGLTWQDVKANRALATEHTNTTGKPIQLCVVVVHTGSSGSSSSLQLNGEQTAYGYFDAKRTALYQQMIPDGATYQIDADRGYVASWWEWRS